MDANESLGGRDKSGDLGCYIRVEITLSSGVQETITIPLIGATVYSDVLRPYDKKSIISVFLSEGVKAVGDYAFAGLSSLASVTLGNSVKTIGEGSFYRCSNLSLVTLGESVKTIGMGAFMHCLSLESITLPESITEFGINPFFGCKKLTVTIKTRDEEVFQRIKELLPRNLGNFAVPYFFSKAKSARSVIEPDGVQGDSKSSAKGSIVAQSGIFTKKSNDEPGEEAIAPPSYPKN